MLRQIAKHSIARLLRIEARLILWKYQPKIIAITGNVGKTGTKEAVRAVLATKYRVRANQKSFNSELGVPLTIIGCDNPWWDPLAWLKVFLEGLVLILFRSQYPECLVLEVGVDRPGDMREMTSWLKPHAVIITRLPDLPVHVEFFESPEQVAAEKWLLAESVPDNGLVVYNRDDEKIQELATRLKCRTISYGFAISSQVRGSDPRIACEAEQPVGLGLRVDYLGHSVPFRLAGVLGFHQLYSLLAAIALGVTEEINLVDMSQVLATIALPPGRMRLISGIKETLIIDDTYNSSPAALEAALETLSELRIAGRKIAVLGDMLELGPHTIAAHRMAGARAARVAHLLVTVGLRMQFATEEASRKKMGKRVLHHFNDSREAGRWLQNEIQPGDVILVKGSQSLRMERVVEEIIAEPERRKELLVRQDPEWLKK